MSKENFSDLVKGVLESFEGHIDKKELDECLKDEGEALLIGEVAYQLFETAYALMQVGSKKEGAMMGLFGLLELKAALSSAEQGVPACEHIWAKTHESTTNKDELKVNAHSVIE